VQAELGKSLIRLSVWRLRASHFGLVGSSFPWGSRIKRVNLCNSHARAHADRNWI